MAVPTFLIVMLASAFARADAIYLQGGRVLQGSATVDGDKVTVELESGRVSFARDEVLRIDKAMSPLDEEREREAKLKPNDIAGTLALADWCRDHDLNGHEHTLLERILEQEPDHADARRRLGYVRVGKEWALRSSIEHKERRADEVERKHREVELAEASLRRERAELELKHAKAQLAREREYQTQNDNYVAHPAWYSPVVVAPSSRYWNNSWSRRPALHDTPWGAPGANTGFPVNGFRSPASYIDDAHRAAYGNHPPPR